MFFRESRFVIFVVIFLSFLKNVVVFLLFLLDFSKREEKWQENDNKMTNFLKNDKKTTIFLKNDKKTTKK